MNNLTIDGKLIKLAQEYHFLGTLPQLSESQHKRLVEILEIAELDDHLSQLIYEMDNKLAKELNLLDVKSLAEYENQRAKIRESLVRKLPQEYDFLRD